MLKGLSSEYTEMENASNGTATISGPRCGDPTDKMNILYTIYLILVMLLTLCGNLLVIVAVYLFQRLRRMTNYLIVSLAVSDLLFALMSLPLRMDQTVHNFNWCLGVPACTYWAAIDAVFCSASICNLAAISIDRFLAITKPLDYPRIMTRRAVQLLIGFVWFYACLWGLLSLFNWKKPGVQHIMALPECANTDRIYFTAAAALSFFLPLLVVVFCYSWVFKVALTHAKAIAAEDHTAPRKSRLRSFRLRELKASKTLAIVVGVFVVSWLPFFVILMLAVWCPLCLAPMGESKALALGLKISFIYVLPSLNSCLNPVIYTAFNKEFRSAFGRMLTDRSKSCGIVRPDNSTLSTIRKTSQAFLSDPNAKKSGKLSLSGSDRIAGSRSNISEYNLE